MPDKFPWTLAAYLGGLFLLIAVVGISVRSCDDRRNKGAQIRVEHSQAAAASNSAEDAIATVGASGARETASENLSRSNEKEIRDAKGANAPVDPAARDAGLRALCRRQAYRNDQRCKLLKPAS